MRVIIALSNATDALIRWLEWPFRSLPPVVALAVISGLTGAVVLVVFKLTSNQALISRAKKELQAHLLRILIYRHDLAVMIRAERDLLVANLRYLRYALPAFALVLGPMVLLFARLDARYGYQPAPLGKPLLVSVRLRGANYVRAKWQLQAEDGVQVETSAIRIPALCEVNWRVRPTMPGHFVLRITDGKRNYDKELVAGLGAFQSVSVKRASRLLELLWSTEAPLSPEGPVTSIEISYPRAHLSMGPLRMHWVVIFLTATIISALILRGPLRTQL